MPVYVCAAQSPCEENTNILYFLLDLKFSLKNTDFSLTLNNKGEAEKVFILKIIALNLLPSDKEACLFQNKSSQ